MQIFIFRDGEQYGPYSPEQVREHLAQGTILPNDWAFQEGMENMVPLSQLMDSIDATESPEPSQPNGATSGPDQDGSPPKKSQKKMGAMKKVIYGLLITVTLMFAAARFGPTPKVDVDELKSFLSDFYSENYGRDVGGIELKMVEEKHEWDKGETMYACSLEITKRDGSKGRVVGTVTAGWSTYLDLDQYDKPNRMGRFRIGYTLREALYGEKLKREVRNALINRFNQAEQTRGTTIEGLDLNEEGDNRFAGTVGITKPDGAKAKLAIEVKVQYPDDGPPSFTFNTRPMEAGP